MLGMEGSGKYLSNKWHDKRAKYKDDPEAFGDDEKAWIEASNIPYAGDTKQENWLIENQPSDVWYEYKGSKVVDVRDIKQVHQGKED